MRATSSIVFILATGCRVRPDGVAPHLLVLQIVSVCSDEKERRSVDVMLWACHKVRFSEELIAGC